MDYKILGQTVPVVEVTMNNGESRVYVYSNRRNGIPNRWNKNENKCKTVE